MYSHCTLRHLRKQKAKGEQKKSPKHKGLFSSEIPNMNKELSITQYISSASPLYNTLRFSTIPAHLHINRSCKKGRVKTLPRIYFKKKKICISKKKHPYLLYALVSRPNNKQRRCKILSFNDSASISEGFRR